jgi:four helix bundle protein
MYTHTSLQAWQSARSVSLGVIEASKAHWKPWAGPVFGQLQRASLSVQLNIAEGWTFNRSPTYARHLGIAFGSAVETTELIGLAVAVGAIPSATGETLLREAERSKYLLIGLLKKHRPMTAKVGKRSGA